MSSYSKVLKLVDNFVILPICRIKQSTIIKEQYLVVSANYSLSKTFVQQEKLKYLIIYDDKNEPRSYNHAYSP